MTIQINNSEVRKQRMAGVRNRYLKTWTVIGDVGDDGCGGSTKHYELHVATYYERDRLRRHNSYIVVIVIVILIHDNINNIEKR